MHLASAALTPTIGLFSVTDEKIYGPYNGKSLAVHINGDAEQELLRKAIRKILGASEERPSMK